MGLGSMNPGCNCFLQFEVLTQCTGRLAWCTQNAGVTLVQRLSLSSTWETVATIAAGSPAVYAVDHTQNGRSYRVICEVCPGQGTISNAVVVQLCTLHSFWYRLHKLNQSSNGNTVEGAEFVQNQFGTFIRDLRTGTTWSQPENIPFNLPGVARLFSWGCTAPSTPNTTGSATGYVMSRVHWDGGARNGYTFDLRHQENVSAPNCGSNFSISFFWPRGLQSLGNVTLTQTATRNYTEIARWNFTYAINSAGILSVTGTSGFIQSSGMDFQWSSIKTDSASISLWLPPSNLWPDGSSFPAIPIDPTGNTVGIIADNATATWSETGTKAPCINEYPVSTPTIFQPRIVRTLGSTEFRLRTCGQFFAGTNQLPPATVSSTDPCPIFDFAWFASPCLP